MAAQAQRCTPYHPSTMAPVNGLNGESEWREWTTAAGQSKVHFITE